MASYDLIAISVLLVRLFLIGPAPVFLGRFLGRRRPGLSVLRGSLLGSLPATFPISAVLLSLLASGDIGKLRHCQPPECGMGMIWIELFLWLAIPIFLIGFALGWLGFKWGRRGADEHDYTGDL